MLEASSHATPPAFCPLRSRRVVKFKMERGEGDERKCESSWSSFALYELQSKAIQLLNGMDDGALIGGRVIGTFVISSACKSILS